ncbi:MAG: cobyrinate a,c-diamide synthase [Caldimicrobium sp.]
MAKGFIISAPKSGEGKTLITLGILRLLTKRGLKVQPFKVGPDFIDPKWHALSTNKVSYNLDLFSMGKDRLKALFYNKAMEVDFAVVEGVMGLFDGRYSTFEVAKLLKLPIVLVVDAFGVAESLSYIVKGFSERVKRAGLPFYLFLNRVSSERHLLRLKKALKSYPIAGYLFRKKEYELPSRHLGLFLPEHFKEAEKVISIVAEDLEKNFDLSIFKPIDFSNFEASSLPSFLPEIPFKKIGIAFDEAFNFYYPHLLEELKKKSEILFFSPLRDTKLPSEVGLLYFGGGYPELFAKELGENKSILKEIKAFFEDGRPIYAECGGLLYLSKGLYWEDKFYPMAGIFPFETRKKGLTLGYRKVTLCEKHPFFEGIKRFYAHEFHYTDIIETQKRVDLKKIFRVYSQDGKTFLEGFYYRNALATYMHFIAKA